jgi:hypothetical protein
MPLAALDVWMVRGIIALSYVVDFKNTVLICIHFSESLLDNFLPRLVHWTLDGLDELIEINGAIIIDVKKIEEMSALVLAKLESKVA